MRRKVARQPPDDPFDVAPGWLVVAGDERAGHVRVDHLAVQAGGDEGLHQGVHHEVRVLSLIHI